MVEPSRDTALDARDQGILGDHQHNGTHDDHKFQDLEHFDLLIALLLQQQITQLTRPYNIGVGRTIIYVIKLGRVVVLAHHAFFLLGGRTASEFRLRAWFRVHNYVLEEAFGDDTLRIVDAVFLHSFRDFPADPSGVGRLDEQVVQVI